MTTKAISRFSVGRAVTIALVALALAGCSVLRGGKRIDMGPFADNTTSLVSEVQFGMSQKQINYIQPFMRGPAVARLREEWAHTQQYLRGIVIYSTQVVAISNSALPGKEKCLNLGKTLDRSFRTVLNFSDTTTMVSRDEMDGIIAEVKSRNEFLDALNAAQPIVDEVERQSNIEFDKYKELEMNAALEIGYKIDSTFVDLLENLRSIEYMQMQSIKSYRQLYDYKRGDASALEQLLREVPSLKLLASGGIPLSPENLAAVESRLAGELAQIKEMRDQIGPEIEWYVASKRELDERRIDVDTLLKKCRIAVMQWARANANLAAGVAVPPMIDIIGMTRGAAEKLVKP